MTYVLCDKIKMEKRESDIILKQLRYVFGSKMFVRHFAEYPENFMKISYILFELLEKY